MSILSTKLLAVERTIAHDLASSNAKTQAVRFLRIAALAAATQLLVTGVGSWGWKALAAVVIGAAETAVRQVWPAIPVDKIAAAVGREGSAVTTPPTPPASATHMP
jgi:hypothetical protein